MNKLAYYTGYMEKKSAGLLPATPEEKARMKAEGDAYRKANPWSAETKRKVKPFMDRISRSGKVDKGSKRQVLDPLKAQEFNNIAKARREKAVV